MSLQVAGIQTDLVWEDPEANFAALAPRIRQARADGARLVVLPEMFPTGFSLDSERIAEPAGGPGEQFLRRQARENDVVLAGSVATRPAGGGKPQNLGLVAFPSGELHAYAKIHPFTFGGETLSYDAGDRPLTVEVDGVRVSLLVCYDLRFAELFAVLAERTDLFCVIASWPRQRREAWRVLLQARAMDTLAYVLGVNRVGEGGGLHYAGDSALYAPGGHRLDQVGPGEEERAEEGMVTGTVDPERVDRLRRAFPVLQDRRPAVYRAAVDPPAPSPQNPPS